MISDLLFYIGFSLLFTHELDAIYRHEWRIFPGLCKIKNDDVAYYWFNILHVPLLVLLLWLMSHPDEVIRFWFKVSMDLFFVVHLGLHRLLISHEKYEFKGVFSKAIILLIAIIGALHLICLILFA